MTITVMRKHEWGCSKKKKWCSNLKSQQQLMVTEGQTIQSGINNYLLPNRRASPSAMEREKDTREGSSALSLCLRRVCIYAQKSVMLHLCTQGHVHGTYINRDRKIICLVAKKSNFNAAVVHASVSRSIFPSFTTPTWQGNSRSSDLKEGETGRGEG